MCVLQSKFRNWHGCEFALRTLTINRYGYHAKENSSNLFVLSSGEIAYAVASVVVLYKYIRNKDKDRDSVKDREDTQRLYLGHTEEVTRYVHLDGHISSRSYLKLVISQAGRAHHIYKWKVHNWEVEIISFVNYL